MVGSFTHPALERERDAGGVVQGVEEISGRGHVVEVQGEPTGGAGRVGGVLGRVVVFEAQDCLQVR